MNAQTSTSAANKRPVISFVIPVLNEEGNIETAYAACMDVIEPFRTRYDYEFVFTDNRSTDNTFEELRSLAARDENVRVFRLSKNFGFEKSVLTGYQKSKGDAVIQLDCDLQDPPEVISQFIEKWEEGYKVVYGVRKQREEGFFITKARTIFYKIINLLSEDTLPINAGEFRLIDRRLIDILLGYDDQQPYLRGSIYAMGFKQIGIPYSREARKHGESKFKIGDLVKVALDGILNHSTVPLRFATYTGLAVSVITLFLILFYMIDFILFGDTQPRGFTTITLLILTSISLNALFLGVIGEYLGRIYHQVKKKPITLIEDAIDRNSLKGQD